ncbi:MAG: hypothetical protein ACI8YQ_000646 [Polaribacter sp.]
MSNLHIHCFNVNQLTTSENQLSFSSGEERIQLHLQLVHQVLSSKNTSHLELSQQVNRARHLAVLAEYAERAIFPKNTLHQKRQPYFVDHQNNACAVGYLLEADGQTKLVNQIKEEQNFSYIAELVKSYPAIIDWTDNNGFTVPELAWIQPTYPAPPTDWHQVGNNGGIEGQINVMKTTKDSALLYMAGNFTAVDGVSANSIIAWDGNDWQTLGDGVTGEIHAMDVTHSGHLYVAGNFVLNSNTNYTNIAVWDGSSWTGLQQGDMEGIVFDIHIQNQVYIGGDFQKVNGQQMAFLARKPFNVDTWNNEVVFYNNTNNSYDTIPNAFSVNAPVHSITEVSGRVLVAGEFSTTAPNVNFNNINTITTDYMAYWNNTNWEAGFTGDYPAVAKVEHIEGRLYVAGFDDEEYAVSVFNNGLWDHLQLNRLDPTITTSLVHGYIEKNGVIYTYGNISNQPILGINSEGLVYIGFTSGNVTNARGANFDKTVRACEVFQDNVYFAGDFTTSDGSNSFNGLTYSSLGPLTSVKNNNEIPVDIYSHNKQLYINYNNLDQETELKVYTIQGTLVCTLSLASGAGAIQEDLSRFADGVFVYELSDGERRSTGKLSVF